MKKKSKAPTNQIAKNKKARFEYHVEETVEAGLSLLGWEVKSLREGRCQVSEAYVVVKKNEVWLLGCQITPLYTASNHVNTDAIRTRKLLLNRREINRLIGLVERSGYALIPLSLYWKRGKVKCDVGLAKGKKLHDKREAKKKADWSLDKARVLKSYNQNR